MFFQNFLTNGQTLHLYKRTYQLLRFLYYYIC